MPTSAVFTVSAWQDCTLHRPRRRLKNVPNRVIPSRLTLTDP